MKVKEVIAELQKFDGELECAVYTQIGEDMDETHSVRLESKDNEESMSYCKGDHLLDCDPELKEIVVIG